MWMVYVEAKYDSYAKVFKNKKEALDYFEQINKDWLIAESIATHYEGKYLSKITKKA